MRERLVSRMELAHRDGEELLAFHGTPQVGPRHSAGDAVRQLAEELLQSGELVRRATELSGFHSTPWFSSAAARLGIGMRDLRGGCCRR